MHRPPASRPAVTPIAFVHALLRAYEVRGGADPGAALQAAQIDAAMLRDPAGRITAEQLETLSRCTMQQLDDEAPGWFTRRLPWGSYGMLARASLSAPNLGVALKRWCRHHALLTDDLLFSLHEADGRAQLRLEERCPIEPAMREFGLLTSLRNLHGVASWFVDSRIPLAATLLPFDAPPHQALYPLLFGGPVQFGAAQAGFDFDAGYLSLPLRRDEAALQAMLQRALQLIVRPYRRDRLLVQRVRALLRERAAELRGADALARELHLSVRTLHRQLADEGATLQALKDDARREQAMDLLRRTRLPIKQIAAAVGFDNDKSFARAFRQWTGVSPSHWRETMDGKKGRRSAP